MQAGLPAISERVPYNCPGLQLPIKICSYPVDIGEKDVSNDPESGRNLAAISTRQLSALCQFRFRL